MNSLGYTPTQNELSKIMKQLDVDDTDTFDFPEFLSFMAGKLQDFNSITFDKESEDALKEAFNVFDSDRDGIIGRRELREVMESLGESVAEEELDDMIREGGTWEAFKRMMLEDHNKHRRQ